MYGNVSFDEDRCKMHLLNSLVSLLVGVAQGMPVKQVTSPSRAALKYPVR